MYMCNELAISPMFNLSMASKELFHSNLLYWLAVAYRNQFKEIMRKLDAKVDSWSDNWKCHREKYHFDLLITDEQEEQFYLVIENKVKSIPHTDQLDDYKEKSHLHNLEWMLLSLATNLPNREEIQKKGWIMRNYRELAYAIYYVLPSITNCYHRQLLEDYCKCILSLHNKQLSWNYKSDCSYNDQFVKGSEDEESLRIEDMRKKVLYSRLAAVLQEKLNAKMFTNKQIAEENGKSDSGNVYVNYGMTRSMGLVDVKIRIKDNLMFVIQLQGVAYKHCVETLDKDGLDFVKGIGLALNSQNSSVKFPAIVHDIAGSFFSSLHEERKYDIFPFKEGKVVLPNIRKEKKNKDNTAYNRYGESFIYQYVKLNDNVTVDEVINAIIDDVGNLRCKLNQTKL